MAVPLKIPIDSHFPSHYPSTHEPCYISVLGYNQLLGSITRMHGLHVKPRWQPATPAERRSFTAFFRPIFPQLAAFHWIYSDRIPFAGVDEDFEALVETICADGHIPPDTLLPKFARFVRENWTDLYGFQKRPDVAEVRRQLQRNPTDYEWMSQNVDLCFFNVDGAWWEIYARDESLLEAVRRHAAGLSDITVQDTLLLRRDDLLRPKF
jgi:hypothetical protein